MKVLTFICIVSLLLIVCGVIYIEWETRDFIESLPQPPSTSITVEKEQQAPSAPKTEATEDIKQMSSEEIQPDLFVESDNTNQPEPLSPETEKIESPTTAEKKKRHDSYDWRDDEAHLHQHSHQIDPWGSVKDRKARGTDKPNITKEELRAQLVDRFGDIPQVHIFVELGAKYDQGESLTINELIEYSESMNHLFPNRKTKQSLSILKRVQSTMQGTTEHNGEKDAGKAADNPD